MYGDVTFSQMAFLVELVERSRQQSHSSPPTPVEWLLILRPTGGTLLRAEASWTDIPADATFYQSLAQRGYLGMLSSEDISSGEVVIWPTERAFGLARWQATQQEGDGSRHG